MFADKEEQTRVNVEQESEKKEKKEETSVRPRRRTAAKQALEQNEEIKCKYSVILPVQKCSDKEWQQVEQSLVDATTLCSFVQPSPPPVRLIRERYCC